MLLAILFYLFLITGTINLVHFGLYLIGANIYDIRASYTLHKSHKSSSEKLEQPLVSVLIPAYNEERAIERCLESVCTSTYKNIEIIVINDGSRDRTSEKVRNFITHNSMPYVETVAKVIESKDNRSIRTCSNGWVTTYAADGSRGWKRRLTGHSVIDAYARVWQRASTASYHRVRLVEQTNNGKASALNNGLRFHVRGELVMMLDADSLIHERAIENAVKYFKDPAVAGVAANVRIIEEPTILGLLQRFEHMIAYRSKKFYTVTNSELIIGGVASTYRRSTLEAVGYYDNDTATEDIGLSMKISASGNKQQRLVYAADVAAMTEGVGDFKGLLKQRSRWKLGSLQNLFKYRSLLFAKDTKYTKMLTWYRVPMSFLGEILLLIEPLVIAYIVYLSWRFLSPALFLSAYMTITVYLLFTIWPDEHLTIRGKIKASLWAPFLYFIFYIMNIVQLVSAVRCIVGIKKIFHLSAKESTWISVQRTGRAVSFS